MADILLVDGYNVIGNWDELSAVKEVSLEEARARLCTMLMRYLTYRWDRIIVVFDAYNVAGRRQSDPGEEAFAEIYSKEGESADLLIERLTARFVAGGDKVEVATSDALEQTMVLARGAVRLSSRELLLQLRQLDRELSADGSGVRPQRLMLDSRLDKRTKEILERWRRER